MFDVLHVSSAHPWTDVRVHQREAASAAAIGYRTGLIAVARQGERRDPHWTVPDEQTGVSVRRITRRPRLRRILVSSLQVITLALRTSAPVVHLHDPELLWAVPVLRLAGRKVVYDAHEDLPDQVRGKEYLRGGRRTAAIVLAHVLVRVACGSDRVIAATPVVARRFPARKTTVVRNLPRVRAHDLGTELARAPRAVYLGSHSRDRGLEALCAIADIPERTWELVTAGPVEHGGHRAAFDELVRAGAIDHRGVLHPTDARNLLLECRVGLLPLRPTPAYRTSIPTKLFEYMAAGLAVVATDVPFWRELLAGVDCVTWVPADDVTALAEAVGRYMDDPDLAVAHAGAGRDAVVETLRWEIDEPALLAVYADLLGGAPLDGLVAPPRS
ncbi:glycosyltransferase [Curtobacterium sp. MCSS17_011]|uniref:glycosyltransferase n=1 Tax=Curtobacterium sp. MCSS17_011 TaxID=2175643 RepID=UPI0015E8CA48|nr:glycosyltransferase [Curtobacterium sp. MCSS17_011]